MSLSFYAISTKIKRVARLRPLCPLLRIIPLASPGRILKEAISPTCRVRSMMVERRNRQVGIFLFGFAISDKARLKKEVSPLTDA